MQTENTIISRYLGAEKNYFNFENILWAINKIEEKETINFNFYYSMRYFTAVLYKNKRDRELQEEEKEFKTFGTDNGNHTLSMFFELVLLIAKYKLKIK